MLKKIKVEQNYNQLHDKHRPKNKVARVKEGVCNDITDQTLVKNANMIVP